ncbi:MAG: adenylosuccinate lyase [Bdellovibrionales bacterium RIFOXYD1_FULL_53_11]|nr:MAG: adenylosuccinate lyase [Bdellovibrionales bacterium RIFOXYD1_FULL_53_11]
MIERYSRPEMSAIWADANKYLAWLKVEYAVCEGLASEGVIADAEWKKLGGRLRKLLKDGIRPERVRFHEETVKHDLIAFTAVVAEKCGPLSRHVHYGLTSSDVLDTALALQVAQGGRLLCAKADRLLGTLSGLAKKFKRLPTIGRSHGIFAEPTSFGLKFLSWHAEWLRNRERLDAALEGMRYGKLSGAVGVSPHWRPAFEQKVLHGLGLRREPVSTQVVPRDRHAALLSALALLGSSIERIAVELRHLQRSEVGEVVEGFGRGQKGSSAMPHKRNPVSSENLTGCARLLRAYAQAALENVALWHERDISHSSVERVALPDAMILLDYALDRLVRLLDCLVVREERVRANLDSAGRTVFSGHLLLALVKSGATREEAYRWVQKCALASVDGKGDFIELAAAHREIARRVGVDEIKRLGSLEYQLRHVDEIYAAATGRTGRRK